MPAIQTSAATILSRFAVSVFFAPALCAAASLVINHEQPVSIETPPGFTYVTQGANGSLSVSLDGFLFCSNIYSDAPPSPTAVTVIPQHDSWTLPHAQDVSTVAYTSGLLTVNHFNPTTLVCHGVGAEGETASPFADGLLRSGLETKAIEQFSHLVNWIPPQGFSWNAPDWSIVPTDPCNGQTPEVAENVGCAAVTGVRPAGSSAIRAPTMWTGTDGSSFFYVARFDAAYGLQDQAQRGMSVPSNLGSAPASGLNAALKIVDAYDGGAAGGGIGYLSDAGEWCIMATLPATLSAGMCNGAGYSAPLSGALNQFIYLQQVPPGPASASFYVAFIRPITGAPPATNDPAVAVSVLFEPALVDVGGDAFSGDDTVFGFLPASPGFPWMSGGP